MSKWAVEGKAWIQLVMESPLRKEDVMISFLKMTRQPTEKKTQKAGGTRKKNPRCLTPLVIENPTSDKKLVLEGRDSKTVVDWVNGHAKVKMPESTTAAVPRIFRGSCGAGVDLGCWLKSLRRLGGSHLTESADRCPVRSRSTSKWEDCAVLMRSLIQWVDK